MRMQIECPACAQTLLVRPEDVGRQARCSQCGQVFALRAPTPPPAPKPKASIATAGPMRLVCPTCSRALRVPAESAGRTARCPCGCVFRVPMPTAPDDHVPMAAYADEPDEIRLVGESQPSSHNLLAQALADGDMPAAPSRMSASAASQVACPQCGYRLPGGTVLCTVCGTNLRTGRRLITKSREGVGDEAEEIHGWVVWVSLIMPLAIVPYRSMAARRHAPAVNKLIAIVTVVVSLWFLLALLGSGSDYPPVTRYMLWTGEQHRPFQLLTHIFLHGGIGHLVGNLLFLLAFGAAVDSVINHGLYLVLYLLMGVVAAWAQMATSADPDIPMVGASGAISGLTGMYLVLFPRHDMHMVAWLRITWWIRPGVKTFAVTGIWVVLIFSAFDVMAIALEWGGNTAHFAHLGGLASGIVFGLVLLLTGLVKSEGYDLLTWLMGDRWRFGRTRA